MMTLKEHNIAMLPRGVRLRKDNVRNCHILLAPERAVQLDNIATAVLQRLDGEASIGEVIDDLVRSFNAPRDLISKDVLHLLNDLVDKRMMEVT